MKYNELIKNRSLRHTQVSVYKEESIGIEDALYIEFLRDNNGGYFYTNSLLLFGFSEKQEQFNILHMNDLYKKYYANLVDGLYFFGQDIFGNGFAFENESIVFFNMESGQKDVLASSFIEWLEVLYNDLDYYTGESLVSELNNDERKELTINKRLSPKYPFILGGEYDINNLVLKNYIENISYNSSIAKQVYGLPAGSKIEIKIE
jgi:hypothetical protein